MSEILWKKNQNCWQEGSLPWQQQKKAWRLPSEIRVQSMSIKLRRRGQYIANTYHIILQSLKKIVLILMEKSSHSHTVCWLSLLSSFVPINGCYGSTTLVTKSTSFLSEFCPEQTFEVLNIQNQDTLCYAAVYRQWTCLYDLQMIWIANLPFCPRGSRRS